jgi:two-component system, cell cycle sensor histidine kinase and response regulator CckA
VPESELLTADAATAQWLRRCDRIRIWTLIGFLAVTAIEPLVGAPVRQAVFVAFIFWLACAVGAERALRLVRSKHVGDRLRTAMLAADVLWIAILNHETGGTRWIGVAAYMFVVAVAAGALSGWATVWLTAWSAAAYGALLYAESSALAPGHEWAGSPSMPVSPVASAVAWLVGAATLGTFAFLIRALVRLLARSEARHRLLFEAGPRPMWVYDIETLRFLTVNDAAVRDYQYSREEFRAMRLTDLRPVAERAGLEAFLAGLGGNYAHCGTWQHRRRDGTLLDAEITSHPVEVDGRHARMVIATDVTDRVRLETRLRETQRLEALGRLAGGVAHEFNNLLAAAMAHAELVLADLTPGTPHWDSADEVIRAMRRGAELTRHLLAFGRRQLLRPEAVDVSAVVRDMERLLRPLLATDVRVTMSLPDEPCWARVDRSQLELMIMNLTMNGRDALPADGALTIETSVVELTEADRKRHPMAAIVAGPYVRLTVSDTGTGISPEVLERIFEPFFTTKPVGRGTGLGLSTVYGIVKQSEGYVWPYSEVGRGTSMHVYLPCAPAPGPASEGLTETAPAPASRLAPLPAAPATASHPRAKKTVLVADDEPALRLAAERILSRAGYRVLAAAAGDEALAVAEADGGRVDVLVTDVVMPRVGGVELAARLGAREPGLRVVYMSGYPQSHLALDGGLAGGHAFVDKPFDVERLLAAVAEATTAASGSGQ